MMRDLAATGTVKASNNRYALHEEKPGGALPRRAAVNVHETSRPAGAQVNDGRNWPRHDQIELLPIAVCVCDRSGVIVDYNVRAADLWGRTPARGKPEELYCGFARMFRQDGGPIPFDNAPMAYALTAAKRVSDFELTVERANRTRLTLLVNIELLRDGHGQVFGAIECFQDISGWKNMTDALHQTKTIEALQRFAGDVAHNYSNLVAAISSNLNMARKRANDPELLRFVEGASRCTEKGSDFIRRLVAFARETPAGVDLGGLDGMVKRMELAEAAAPGLDGAPVPGPASWEDGRKALLVETNAGLRTVARDALATLGFEVIDADSPSAALDIVRSGRELDLAVIDIGLAASGLEFLHRARSLRPGLKVVAMTGHSDLPAGVADGDPHTAILRKPFGIDELAASLFQLLA